MARILPRNPGSQPEPTKQTLVPAILRRARDKARIALLVAKSLGRDEEEQEQAYRETFQLVLRGEGGR